MLTFKVARIWITLWLLLVVSIFAQTLLAGEPQATPSKIKGTAALPSAESSSRPVGKGKAVVVPTRLATEPATPEAVFDKNSYQIGVEDELHISVWREPELSLSVAVRPDGMITLPLLNDIRVVGLQTSELRALLTEKLRPFVNEPQVTVIVQHIRSRKVYLVGQAARQGAYSLNGTKTILELLAESGGVGPFAKADSIYVLRNVGGKQVRIPFGYKKALAGRGDKSNFVLHPGDIVVVP